MASRLILASRSEIRATLLQDAGITFTAIPARIDETAILNAMQELEAPPRDMADTLAEAKARKVSAKHPEALVLGCDQVLALRDEVFQKPNSQDEAIEQLAKLAGKTHHLLSAVVVCQNAEPLWRHVALVRMHMVELSNTQIKRYVEHHWHDVRDAVGGYKIEKSGVNLFQRIEGDYFSVLGLPLLELLGFLRSKGNTPL